MLKAKPAAGTTAETPQVVAGNLPKKLARVETQLTQFPKNKAGSADETAVISCSDNIKFMRQLPDGIFKLIVTSPPYNIGKPYEGKTSLDEYLAMQKQVIDECVRLLDGKG